MADNQLYLTKGQRDAVLDGSDTVDMTDNQMTEMGGAVIDDEIQMEPMKKPNPFENKILGKKGLRALLWDLGLLNPDSKLNENIHEGLLKITQPGRDAADEMFGYMKEKGMKEKEYDFDIDGNKTSFSFGEVEDETMNKNGGVMSFRPGGATGRHKDFKGSYKTKSKSKLEIPDRGRGSSYVPKPKKELQEVKTDNAREDYRANQTFRALKDKKAKENKLRLKRDLIESGRDVDFEEIVNFRNESGISSSEYRDLLDTVKTRAGDKNFYDAGFTKGPGQIIANYIKGGGVLGSIFRSIFGDAKTMGKDLGVAALDKVTDFKEYLSNFGDGVMANQAVEEFTEVQEPITGYEDSGDVFKLPLTDGKQKYKFADYYFNPTTADWADQGNYLKMDPNKGLYVADTTNPTIIKNWKPPVEQGSYDDSAITSNIYAGRSPTDEMYANVFTMNPSDPNSFPMSRQWNQMWKDNMLSDGGGLFPQMTPQDPLMNSFNKNPLSVLQRDNGGVTRQQYEQQYAPKTAAQALGIVDIHDEEGIMGV